MVPIPISAGSSTRRVFPLKAQSFITRTWNKRKWILELLFLDTVKTDSWKQVLEQEIRDDSFDNGMKQSLSFFWFQKQKPLVFHFVHEELQITGFDSASHPLISALQ